MQFELAPKVDLSILDSLTEEERQTFDVVPTGTTTMPKKVSGQVMGFGGHLSATSLVSTTSVAAGRGAPTSSALTVVADAVKAGLATAGGGDPSLEKQLKMKGAQQATVTHMNANTFHTLEKEKIKERQQNGGKGNLMFTKTREEEEEERLAKHLYFIEQRRREELDLASLREEDCGGDFTTGVGSKRGRTEASAVGEPTSKKPRAHSPPIEPVAEITTKYQYDYQGRSFLHSQLRASDQDSTLPSKVIHVWKGQEGLLLPKNKAPLATGSAVDASLPSSASSGITALHWCPPSNHLLFTANMDGLVSLLDVTTHKECVAKYQSHDKAITSLTVSNDGGRHFSTASYDGTIRVWDTEKARCLDTLQCSSAMGGEQTGSSAAHAYCKVHKYHGLEENSHLLLSGVGRKILLWDLRTKGKVAREYDRHLGNVLSLTFMDRQGSKFISTAEDKTVRTWDFNVPVQIQVFADASMHAVPHIAANPRNNSFILQSLDNEAYLMQLSSSGSSSSSSLKVNKDRKFTGHLVSGSSCTIQASPDGRFVSSGDVKGNLFFWDYDTGKKAKSFRAHGSQLVQHLWHPSFPGTVVTGSWDGTVKMWA